jgi:hypothetical protein
MSFFSQEYIAKQKKEKEKEKEGRGEERYL